MSHFLAFLLSVLLAIRLTDGSPTDFDCPMRELAMQFALEINPSLTTAQMQQIADALNGSPEKAAGCNVSTESAVGEEQQTEEEHFNSQPQSASSTIYVSAEEGSDENHSGLFPWEPFMSIQKAVNSARELFGPGQMKQILLRKGTYRISAPIALDHRDSNLVISNYGSESVNISGAALLSPNWTAFKKIDENTTIFQTAVTNANVTEIPGLRVDGFRAVRARYPNGDPEKSFASDLFPVEWVFPDPMPPAEYFYVDENADHIRNDSYATNNYNLALNGKWLDTFVPPASYFSGATPLGLIYNDTVLPHAKDYQNLSGAVLAGWMNLHWESWFWEIDADRSRETDNTLVFGRGGFQGGRAGDGGEFFISNVMAELDVVNEFFFNTSTRTLFFIPNVTDGNALWRNRTFEATQSKVLIELKGNQSHPVSNVVIHGISFIDSAFTFLDDHGAPSGGDWALQYSGAVTLIGCRNVTLTDNLFSRIDGIAVFLFDFNRNISISHNEFAWIGESAIALWGSTDGVDFPELDESATRYAKMGIDGTNGNQPRFVNVSYNFGREIGIYEKQSSFYFQAKACENYIGHNVFFNGPRAGICFNDGFGGSNVIEKNLVFNTCRESSDHGPFNSWDRQPFWTDVGEPHSVVKGFDHISHNFMVSNYGAVFQIDNDDTSQWFKAWNNFLVYGVYGIKCNFQGHDIQHWNNIYAYLEKCMHFYMTTPYPTNPTLWHGNWCVLNVTVEEGEIYDYAAIYPDCYNYYPVPNGGYLASNNSIFAQNGNMNNVGYCNVSQRTIEENISTDNGCTVGEWPDTDDLIQRAKEILWS